MIVIKTKRPAPLSTPTEQIFRELNRPFGPNLFALSRKVRISKTRSAALTNISDQTTSLFAFQTSSSPDQKRGRRLIGQRSDRCLLQSKHRLPTVSCDLSLSMLSVLSSIVAEASSGQVEGVRPVLYTRLLFRSEPREQACGVFIV